MIEFIERYDDYPNDLYVWQAACVLCCTDATVRRYLHEGKINYIKTGKGYLISKSALRKFIVEMMFSTNK